MSIKLQCRKCEKVYNLRDETAGKSLKCKVCGEPMIVPKGGVILRHAPRKKEFEVAIGDGENIERIGEHIARYVGPVETVFHEIVSDLVHVDVHFVPADGEREYHTLVTSGMSDRPMTVPEGAEDFQFAELVLCLPDTWPLSQKDFNDENNYWPVRWLKQLARFPHEYDTWLGAGHTIPNGDPPEPFCGTTEFCCWLIAPPLFSPSKFHELRIDNQKTVRFYSLIALYLDEMNFKLKKGLELLLDRLEEHRVTEFLDVHRRNVCRRRLWPF